MRAEIFGNVVRRASSSTCRAMALVMILALAMTAAPGRAAGAASGPSFLPPSSELMPVQPAAPYGMVVAISGDTAAVTGLLYGRAVVFVFVRSGGSWAQQARLVDPAMADMSSVFGSALALSGDTLAVGAGAEAAPSSSVYVYVRSAGAWSLQAHLQPPPRAASLGFGTALALAGDALVVGVPGSAGSAAGAAHVYARAAGTWRRQAILTATSPAAADRFGRAVGVAHQHVVVGGSGFGEIFDLVDGAWQRAAVLHGSGPGGGFGSSAAASIETVAVGDPAAQAVSLYIHTRAGWFHQADVTPPDAQAGDFGNAISLSQDVLEVGAPTSSRRHAPASGAAYVFTRLQREWRLAGAFGLAAPAAGDRFGAAVAVSGDTALVGSTGPIPVPTTAWLIDGLDNP
jgi:hypothetical protein